MLNILYVEDDDGSRQVMQMAQRMSPLAMNIVILEDSHAFEAHLLALDPEPELILLDIHVQPITGFEMLKIIRKHALFDDVPIIALTASVMNEEIDTLRCAGFDGVVSKPIDLDEFPELMQQALLGANIWHVR